MEEENPTTPVTDGEHWSDEAESTESGHFHAGYQILTGDDGEDDTELEDGEEEQVEPEHLRTNPESAEVWRTTGGSDGSAGREQRQRDVASLMLRAMEEDYRACIDSEERASSNGHTARIDPPPARTSERPRDQPAEGFNQASGDFQANGENGPTSTETPRRPISPLGRDRAERVMRAMQGFTVSAPVLPRLAAPRFEVDWESLSALATLAANVSGAGNDGEGKQQNSSVRNDAQR